MTSTELTPESVPRAQGMPMLGLGTWENEDPNQCADSVRTALETGYRHIDTAQAYGNEDAVGEGIAAADVDRDEIFLATKVWISNLDYEDVLETTQESLDRLGTDYLDLLYVHWPSRTYEPGSTLEAFDELYDEGTIRNIGVSNFEPRHVDEAREHLDAPIFANQVETHPMLQQRELREYAREHDIEIVAYSPLARGDVFEIDVLSEIAEKHGVSEAQVSLAWLRESDVTAIPKATSEAHIRDNWESLTLELDEEDLRKIDSIDRTRRKVDPGFAPW
ncbi:aldo/keto reductase [Halapricum desulfuricans]|uniref:Aldo/keto reductase, related to diketogulonate reductase n=1 Tax=Halapricum desulfuricans TaxID=2841257 RepID=A0A897MVY8_9EURY|nr:Aldo/keto reductase, related to diketogulonate reductase [Halapricum desulfuricans]